MTLFQIIQILKEIALTQPNIKSATDGSIYDVMNTNPSVKYDVVHFSQTTHQSDEETDYYGLNIFYVSRLEDSLEDNRLQIQSIGKEILDNIIRTFCENWGIDFPIITYTPFTQKFNDLCAGCYCNLRLEIPKEIICADDFTAEVVPGSGIKLQDIGITITQNGLVVVTPDAEYDGIGEVRIEVDVPQSAAVLRDKEVEYTENGSYTVTPDSNYDGLSSVSVDVDVPDRYDEGYDDGKQDGENEQKAKLTVTSFTENNTYTRADGWSAVTVDVPQTGQTINNQTKSYPIHNLDTQLIYYDKPGDEKWMYIFNNSPLTLTYDSGYTGLEKVRLDLQIDAYEAIELGENQQKAKMSALTVTANGEYNSEDGWSAVTVNVPQGQGYEDGYEDGEAAQKAKMISLSVTANGQYDREDGYSAVTVNVPDRYDEGYDDGYAAGAAACSGLLASSITLNVASAITDSGTATTTFSPSTAYTDIYYTSSDTSKATIDENTGEITVIANGTVTICTRDRMSGLQDCKTVTVARPDLLPLTFEIISGGTIIWANGNCVSPVYPKTIQYRKNNGEWISIESGVICSGNPNTAPEISVEAGDTICFRGDNASYGRYNENRIDYNMFRGTAKFNAYGNIMSLVSSTGFSSATALSNEYTFLKLFDGCEGLVSVRNLILPATELTNYCYSEMFGRCTSLTDAPELPATRLANGCYELMFSGCRNLTKAPSSLPATTLASNCYRNMFLNCTNLVTVPDLPARTLVANCYYGMFRNTKVNRVKCLATNISAENCTFIWLQDCPSNGTFIKNASMSSWPSGDSGIPTNWVIQNA